MKAIFDSVKKVKFTPMDNNERVLLENFRNISESRLKLVKDEKYEDISLEIVEPRTLELEDNLANRLINMNFPDKIRDMIDSHTIMKMKDGSYIDCLVLTEEEPSEDTTIPAKEITEVAKDESTGKIQAKCTCGMTFETDSIDNITHTDEEHEKYYLEHKDVSNEGDTKEPSEGNESDSSNIDTIPTTNENGTVTEGYYVDPTAPNGYRKCRPGHIHGATYMHPICCIHGDHNEALMKRTILVRLMSETLGEVVLYSLVGVDDVRINMQLYKVITATDMMISDVNKDSLFYNCFTI